MDAIDFDRRRLLAVAGLLAVPAMTEVRPRDTDADAAETLQALETELTDLAAGYETAPPALSVARGWELAQRSSRLAEMNRRSKLYRAYMAVSTRALVLEANGLVDTRQDADARRVIGMAAALATHIDDRPTAAHAYAVEAQMHRNLKDWANGLRSAERGLTELAGAETPVAIMLAGAQASGRAALGDLPASRVAIARGDRIMARLPPAYHGPVGYSLDAYHPAMWSAARAEVFITAGLGQSAAEPLAEARARADDAVATGLQCSVRLLQAQAAMTRRKADPDEARERAADAVLVAQTGSRPAPWLVACLAGLARQTEQHGVLMYDLVGAAKAM